MSGNQSVLIQSVVRTAIVCALLGSSQTGRSEPRSIESVEVIAQRRSTILEIASRGDLLLNCSFDRIVTLSDLRTGGVVAERKLDVLASYVDWSADGKSIFCAQWDGAIVQLQANSLETMQSFHSHEVRRVPTGVSVSKDGQWLFATYMGKVSIVRRDGMSHFYSEAVKGMSIWHLPDTVQRDRFGEIDENVACSTLSSDGTVAAFGLFDGRILLRDVHGRSVTIPAHGGPLIGLRIGKGNSLLYSFGGDNKLRRWSIKDARMLQEWSSGSTEGVMSLSPDDKLIAVSGRNVGIRLIDSITFVEIANCQSPCEHLGRCTFTSDGKHVLCVGRRDDGDCVLNWTIAE